MGPQTLLFTSIVLSISSCLGEPIPLRYYPNVVYNYPNEKYHDDNIYITDKYGQTSAVVPSSRSSRYYGSSDRYYTNPYAACYPYCRGGRVYVTGQTTSPAYTNARYQYSRAMAYVESCSSGTCGQNAQCSIIGSRPVCSCFKNYMGDPLTVCTRAECLSNEECRGHQTCRNGHCINPCESVCGANANCDARDHLPVCSCPHGYTGNPFTQCRRFDPEELCHPSPCGENTHCTVVNEVPTCKCLPGYHGSPIAGCRHECENDAECGPASACMEFKCQNPCSQCGINAECETVRNHQAVCKCPRGYYGNAYSSCQPECTSDSDCPAGKPACFYNSCKNPCDDVCGTHANCELRGLTPVCSCPKDMTGDPFVYCRPFTKEDLCEPNPCGANSRCQPGYDKYNKERPVCTCHTGYVGNAVQGCTRGECTEDSHCLDSQNCVEYTCQNPCINQCGINAMCNPRRHLAVCTCPQAYSGDALTQCIPPS